MLPIGQIKLSGEKMIPALALFNKVKLIGALVVVAAVVGFMLYMQHLRKTIDVLEANAIVLETNVELLEGAIETQKEVITKQRADHENVVLKMKQLDEASNKYNQEIENLRSKFNTRSSGDPRDFKKITKRKPKLVENIVNKASREAMDCLEAATGGEMNAKSNSQCPSIVGAN